MISNLHNNINQWLNHLIDGSFDRLIIRLSMNLFNDLIHLYGKDFLKGQNYNILSLDSNHLGPLRDLSNKSKLKAASSSEILDLRNSEGQDKFILFASVDSNIEDSIKTSSRVIELASQSYLGFRKDQFHNNYGISENLLSSIEKYILNDNLNSENLSQKIDQFFYKEINSKSDVASFYGIVQNIDTIENYFISTSSFKNTDYYKYFIKIVKEQIDSQKGYNHLKERYQDLSAGSGSAKISKIFQTLTVDSINELNNPGGVGDYFQTLLFCKIDQSYYNSFTDGKFIEEIIKFEKNRDIKNNSIYIDNMPLKSSDKFSIFNFDENEVLNKPKSAFLFHKSKVNIALKDVSTNYFSINNDRDTYQTDSKIVDLKNEFLKVGIDDSQVNDVTFINFDEDDCPSFFAIKGMLLLQKPKLLKFNKIESEPTRSKISIKTSLIIRAGDKLKISYKFFDKLLNSICEKELNIIVDINSNNNIIKLNNHEIEFIFSAIKDSEEIIVRNVISQLKASNQYPDKVVNIIPISNEVEHLYFDKLNNKYELFWPLNVDLSASPSFSKSNQTSLFNFYGDKIKQPSEFRPKKLDFDQMSKSHFFCTYLENRNKIIEWYNLRQLNDENFNFDQIDFDGLKESILISYVDAYNMLLQDFPDLASWLDMYFIYSLVEDSETILDETPLATFYSPLNPILLSHLFKVKRILEQTFSHKPNPLCSLLDVNPCEYLSFSPERYGRSLIFKKSHFQSLLNTGFVNVNLYSGMNNLRKVFERNNIIHSHSLGSLSPSDLRSALDKSFNFVANKNNLKISLVSNDESSQNSEFINTELVKWIINNKSSLSNNISNSYFHVDVLDTRVSKFYPKSDSISFNRSNSNISLDWYTKVSKDTKVDVSLITTEKLKNDIRVMAKASKGFRYKDLINFSVFTNKSAQSNSSIFYHSNIIREINYNLIDELDQQKHLNKVLRIDQPGNQVSSDIRAISSDSINFEYLSENNNIVWEFSLSNYSYDSSSQSSYYLIGNEKEFYFSNLKTELDNMSVPVDVDKFICLSKSSGLFQLKRIISNQNDIKGDIASVLAFELLKCYNSQKENVIIVSYDIFKERLTQINEAYDSNFKTGQYPDFIIISLNDNQISLRFLEVKYRSKVLSSNDIAKILKDQTESVSNIFKELDNERYMQNGLWKDTLSILLCDLTKYFLDRLENLNIKSSLTEKFNDLINSDYKFNIEKPILFAVDATKNLSSDELENGVFFKLPFSKINDVINGDCNSNINLKFNEFIENLNIDQDYNNLSENKIIIEASQLAEIITDEQDLQEDNDLVFLEDDSELIEVDETSVKQASDEVTNSVKVLKNTSSFEKEIILGKDNQKNTIVYDPKGLKARLPNYNIMVTGSSGKGKTQFIKSFIYQTISSLNTKFTIIDFKNDYSDKYFLKNCNIKKSNIKINGIPYNPLIPNLFKDDDAFYFDIPEHIDGISSVLASTFGLGDIQEGILKKSIRELFKLHGINPTALMKFDESISFPSFNNLGEYIQENSSESKNLFLRLDPLFSLNLFQEKYDKIRFDELLQQSYVFNVSSIQNDKIKNAIAKIIIKSSHGYFMSKSHKKELNNYFVFDEAHRIIDSQFLEMFIRECRAFGVGIMLSSQNPTDFPSEIQSQLSTKIIHGNEKDAKLVKTIKNLISFSDSTDKIENLTTFNAIINSQDYNNPIIHTLSWPHLMVFNIIKDYEGDYIDKSTLENSCLENGINDIDNIISSLNKYEYISVDENKYSLV